MQGFKLENGDILIEKGEIQMTSGADLLRQTVETVLNTNKGEWWLDVDEGITYSNILGKHQQSVGTGDKDNTATGGENINRLLENRLDGVI